MLIYSNPNWSRFVYFNYSEDFFMLMRKCNPIKRKSHKRDTSIFEINDLRLSKSLIFCDHTVDNALLNIISCFQLCLVLASLSLHLLFSPTSTFTPNAAASSNVKWNVFLIYFLNLKWHLFCLPSSSLLLPSVFFCYY